MHIQIYLYLHNVMATTQTKTRGKNFTEIERQTLTLLVGEHARVLETKVTNATNNRRKTEAWESIAEAYNSQIAEPRSTASLKECYEGMKKKFKKKIATDRLKELKTGRSPKPENQIKESGELLLNIMNGQVIPPKRRLDSSADDLGDEVDDYSENEDDTILTDEVPVEVCISASPVNPTRQTTSTEKKPARIKTKRRLKDVYNKVTECGDSILFKHKREEFYEKKLYEVKMELLHMDVDHKKKMHKLELEEKLIDVELKQKILSFQNEKNELELQHLRRSFNV